MDKDQRNIYFVNEFVDNDIVSQLKWSTDTLKSNNEIENNFYVYQGQIVEYMHYDVSRNKFFKILAIALSDSSDKENNLIICPLMPIRKPEDIKEGINIGKILNVSTQFDFVATILGIKCVSKQYIKVNNLLNKNWIGFNCVSKIIETYRNFLKNIVRKQSNISHEFVC